MAEVALIVGAARVAGTADLLLRAPLVVPVVGSSVAVRRERRSAALR